MTYANPAIAEAAIEQFNNIELGGRPIHIRLDRKEVENSGGFPGKQISGASITLRSALDADKRIVKKANGIARPECLPIRQCSARAWGYLTRQVYSFVQVTSPPLVACRTLFPRPTAGPARDGGVLNGVWRAPMLA